MLDAPKVYIFQSHMYLVLILCGVVFLLFGCSISGLGLGCCRAARGFKSWPGPNPGGGALLATSSVKGVQNNGPAKGNRLFHDCLPCAYFPWILTPHGLALCWDQCLWFCFVYTHQNRVPVEEKRAFRNRCALFRLVYTHETGLPPSRKPPPPHVSDSHNTRTPPPHPPPARSAFRGAALVQARAVRREAQRQGRGAGRRQAPAGCQPTRAERSQQHGEPNCSFFHVLCVFKMSFFEVDFLLTFDVAEFGCFATLRELHYRWVVFTVGKS